MVEVGHRVGKDLVHRGDHGALRLLSRLVLRIRPQQRGRGDGGAGAGGAGGVSVGVLYKGSQPTLDQTTVTTGALGPKGAGGKPGTNDGIDGQKADALEVQ